MIDKTELHQAAEENAQKADVRVAACEADVRTAQTALSAATEERWRLVASRAQGEQVTPKQLTAVDDEARELQAAIDLAAAVLGEAQKQQARARQDLQPLHNEWVIASHTALKEQRHKIAEEVDSLVQKANEKLEEANALLIEHHKITAEDNMHVGGRHIPPRIQARVKVMIGEIPTTTQRAAHS